jgi:hypothetical protein
VQQVDVLGDHGLHEPEPLELGERQVRRVRLGAREHREARRIELPDLLRVGAERLDRSVLEWVDSGPQAGRRAEVGNPALGRDARAGENDARLRLE